MAMSQAVHSYETFRQAHPSSPLFHMEFKFHNRKPGKVTKLLTLTYPFDISTWAWVLTSSLTTFVAIYLAKVMKKYNMSVYKSFTLTFSPLLKEAFPNEWISLWAQGHSRYLQFLLFVWLPCGFLLSAAYTSNLKANLIAVSKEDTVDTLQDILDNGHLLAIMKGNNLARFFTESNDTFVRRVFKVVETAFSN